MTLALARSAVPSGSSRFRRTRAAQPVPPAILEDWQDYRATGSVNARNRLISHYMSTHVRPLVIRVASSLPHQVDIEDLIQQGYFGLVDAMDRFDLSRDVRFETFSRRRIFGAIHDYLRCIDPVPRLSRARSKKVAAMEEVFRKEHGRLPGTDELQQLLGVTGDEFGRYLADRSPAAMVPFSHVHPDAGSGDDLDPDAMDTFEDTRHHNPLRRLARRDLRRWITKGFDHRDRLIIILYYYEHMTMREIGQVLGASESRVSQRLESILQCLRSRLLGTGAEHEFNLV